MAIFDQIKEKNQLMVETQENPPEAPLICEICEKCLSSKPNHTTHIKTHLSDNYCGICCNSYNTKFKLDAHFTTHKTSLENIPQHYVKCDFENCTQEFSSKLQFHHHKNIHLNIIKLKCNICGLKFSRRAAWKNHKRRHYTRLVCATCGKIFIDKKTLKEHERFHTGEKPFECQHCNKKFRCQSGLKYHEAGHLNERKYECKMCGLCFNRSNYLKEHLRKHSNDKPYCCQYCPTRFTQSNILKRHEMKMHIRCDVCNLVIGKAKDLLEHKWKEHKLY